MCDSTAANNLIEADATTVRLLPRVRAAHRENFSRVFGTSPSTKSLPNFARFFKGSDHFHDTPASEPVRSSRKEDSPDRPILVLKASVRPR